MPTNPQCQLCERCKTATNICLWGRSVDEDKEIMIILDSVSKETDRTGLLTQGQTGQQLLHLLTKLNWVHNVYVTTATKCYAPNKPTAKEYKSCRKYLLEEIETIKPKLIICLGTIAANALFGRIIPLKQLRQRFTEIETENHRKIKVACSYSPAIIFVDPTKFPTLQKDLDWIKSNYKSEEEKFDYVIAINEKLPKSRIYGFDIESTGLNTYTDELLSYAFADPKSKVAVGYGRNHSPENCISVENFEQVNALLENKENILVGHNIKYDVKHVEQFDEIKIKAKLYDTSIMHSLIDENSIDNSLKALSAIYTNLGHYEDGINVSDLKNEDFEKVITYNCFDSITPLKIFEKLYPELKKQKLLRIFEFISEMLSIFCEIEQTGIQINKEKLFALKIKNDSNLSRLKNKYIKVNLNSDVQIAYILYTILQCEVVQLTKGKAPSTSKDTLFELKAKSLNPKQEEFVDDILEYRKVKKTSEFIDNILLNLHNGRLHTTYNLGKGFDERDELKGTVTGRTSSSNPNLQNIPTNSELREVFEKSSNYKYFVTADYSQIELRVAAFLSREPNFISAFKEGKDIHTALLAKIQGEDYIDVYNAVKDETNKYHKHWYEYRLVIKRVNFGILYGIGIKKLIKVARQMGLNLTEQQVEKLIVDWQNENQVLMNWIRNEEDFIIYNGFSRTIFERIRHLPGATRKTPMGHRILRQGINYPIQSAASDICLLGIYHLYHQHHQDNQSRLLMTVHDEINHETNIEDKETIIQRTKYAMTNKVIETMFTRFNIAFDIPLDVDIHIGNYWEK